MDTKMRRLVATGVLGAVLFGGLIVMPRPAAAQNEPAYECLHPEAACGPVAAGHGETEGPDESVLPSILCGVPENVVNGVDLCEVYTGG